MAGRPRHSITAQIVAAYVSNNSVPASDLPALIAAVNRAVADLSAEVERQPAAATVAPGESITNQYLICLEDGLRFKSLKRHLRKKFNLSPEQYRSKWDLPPDYPMVAPAYSKARSAIAREIGLGVRRRTPRPGARRKPADELPASSAPAE